MSFCSKCGNKLGEKDKFCTNCGAPVGAAAAGRRTGENIEKTQASGSRLRLRTYKIGGVDYRTLNNVKLVSKSSQHTVYHITCHFVDVAVAVYLLFFLFKISRIENFQEIEYVPGLFPGVYVVILIGVVSGFVGWKVRHDIVYSLPRGFDYWKIRRLLKWEILGFESLKTAFRRILLKEDCDYPELGFGSDDEGNYYAFAVQGDDVGRYRSS